MTTRRAASRLREDRGAHRAVETVAVLLLTTGVVLAVTRGPVSEEVSCMARRTIVLLESSGGVACGQAVGPTRLADVRAAEAAQRAAEDVQEPAAEPPPAEQEPAAQEPPADVVQVADEGGSTGRRWTVSGMAAGDQRVAGLGARKQELLDAGATMEDLAVAMLENDTLSSNYAYGDGKGGDATNFGIFKQNWGMISAADPALAAAGIGPAGERINTDLATDIAALHASRARYGDAWVSGHRNGASGLANPNTTDIANYEAAVGFIAGKLREDPARLSDDTRIWVEVPAI